MNNQQIYYEQEVSRNSFSLKAWWNYLYYLEQSHVVVSTLKGTGVSLDTVSSRRRERFVLYERAVKYLPRSYKLWHSYLKERVESVRYRCVTSKGHRVAVNAFERALVHLHKMPRIWLDYCDLLIDMKKGTEVRKVFDRALQALPVTQHKELWNRYVSWSTEFGVEETSICVFRRYLMFEPMDREKFVDFLEGIGQFEEAARQLCICLNDEHYVSPSGQSTHQLWMRLCDLCAKHPQTVVDRLPVEQIMRSGIARFSDEVGTLWSRLADFYIRLGQFERARDVFEEAVHSVSTVRDFTTVFDNYVKVEEALLTTQMRFLQDNNNNNDNSEEVDLRLSRIEHLLEQRPLLLNSVMLRQNPHNVHEWQKRIKLLTTTTTTTTTSADSRRLINTYVDALRTIDPSICTGKLSSLWLGLSRLYENNNNDLDNARLTMEKATEVKFKSVDELANVWCAWGEMEMRHEKFQEALVVMRRATTEPTITTRTRRELVVRRGRGDEYRLDNNNNDEDGKGTKGGKTVLDRVHLNVKVWNLCLDLEESLGSIESCRSAYDKVMEWKVATVQTCLNYCCYLEEHDFFEDSFQVLERAVSMFVYPQLKSLWLLYLDKFMNRYGGTKLERLRDLFEASIANVPEEYAAEFYIKYGKAEEQYGLSRHALSVYERATVVVPTNQRLDMFRLYAKKVSESLGVTKTRPIYERAIKELDDKDSKVICIEFAEMERRLGEIDRSRSIWRHGSQLADPRRDVDYWNQWRRFEETHGNEDTFRDMLRVQRAVETSFSQVNYLASEMIAGEFFQSATTTTTVPSSVEAMERDAIQQQQQQQQQEEQIGQKRKIDDEDDDDESRKKKLLKIDEAEIDI